MQWYIIVILAFVAGLIGGFVGKLIHEVVSKPEGEIIIDEMNTPFLAWNKIPEKIKNGERCIFVTKRIDLSKRK